MKQPLLRFTALAVALTLLTPLLGQAKTSKTNRPLVNPLAVDGKGDANAIGKFNSSQSNKKIFKVNGKVTAVSGSSMTIQVSVSTSNENANDNSNASTNTAVTLKSYTFAIDSKTVVIRKFKGTASINEVAVGDHVRVWATSKTDGTAKLIWDKSIWWASVKGVISALDTSDKMFTLTVTIKKIEYTTTVKTDSATTYWQGTTPKTFSDLANGQTVAVRGSWNSLGKYILAKKIVIVSS